MLGASCQQKKPTIFKPILARASTQVLPSLWMWDTIKFIVFVISMQFNHLFLKAQGIERGFLKANTRSKESVSSQMFFQFLLWAISIARMAPKISAMKVESVERFCAKQPLLKPSEDLKIPPQAAFRGFLVTAPKTHDLRKLNLISHNWHNPEFVTIIPQLVTSYYCSCELNSVDRDIA